MAKHFKTLGIHLCWYVLKTTVGISIEILCYPRE